MSNSGENTEKSVIDCLMKQKEVSLAGRTSPPSIATR